MDFEKSLILILVFIFAIFLFPNIETAINGIGGAEPLKPILDFIPIGFVGCVFVALFYLGWRK